MNAIEASGLGKSFGSRKACSEVTFEVRQGEVFGLLGPNGAGKTTTLRMLAGLYAPDEGSASVAGFSIEPGKPGGPELRRKVGLLTESPGFYDRLTARENLLYFGRLQGARDSQTQKLLDRFALAPHADRPFAELSRGMKQKLAIARALLHEPEVIFLDEPTVGLDPEATREVRSVVAELAAERRTIVLCTHHLDEVERLCARAAFIAGRLLAVHEIRQTQLLKIDFAEPFEGKLQLIFEPQKPVHELVSGLVARGARISAVIPHKDPLEEAWLQLLAEARERGLTA